jgi:MerR family transcriptional regulator/heat shock protein HspR
MTDGEKDNRRRARSERDRFDDDRGVFMISVAAELAGMHPQTLRLYESRGLIKPRRSPKQTRLYSQRDVERLRRIQALTGELGMNLAGVEQVLKMEETMRAMRRRMRELERHAEELQRRMLDELDAVHRSYKRELVRWEPPGEMLAPKDSRTLNIPIQRKNRKESETNSDAAR